MIFFQISQFNIIIFTFYNICFKICYNEFNYLEMECCTMITIKEQLSNVNFTQLLEDLKIELTTMEGVCFFQRVETRIKESEEISV